MTETEVIFNNGAAYERFMGRWSRLVGTVFLDWLAAPRDGHWLDVGCGTGTFTELVVNTRSPATLVGVDPAIEQIEYARRLPVAEHARFTIADATALPFADGCFDVITSALVINFIPDRPRALAEMRRVAKPGGLVALYVWDLAEGGAPTWPMTQGMRSCGIPPPQVPGVRESTLESLQSLFERTGFESTEARRIEVTATYHDFDDFWTSNTPAFSPMGRCVAALTETDRLRLRASVASALPVNADGSITYAARANAIKGGVTSRPRGGMSDPNYRMSSNVSGST